MKNGRWIALLTAIVVLAALTGCTAAPAAQTEAPTQAPRTADARGDGRGRERELSARGAGDQVEHHDSGQKRLALQHANLRCL